MRRIMWTHNSIILGSVISGLDKRLGPICSYHPWILRQLAAVYDRNVYDPHKFLFSVDLEHSVLCTQCSAV